MNDQINQLNFVIENLQTDMDQRFGSLGGKVRSIESEISEMSKVLSRSNRAPPPFSPAKATITDNQDIMDI
jgi:hypothetical protein